MVVIPAQGPSRQPDPIVWFAGGPGDSAVDMADRVRPLVGSVTDRDLVLIEQRGTGSSNVTCKQLPDLTDRLALCNAVTSCLRGLKVEPRFYSTAAFADDVDQALTSREAPRRGSTPAAFRDSRSGRSPARSRR